MSKLDQIRALREQRLAPKDSRGGRQPGIPGSGTAVVTHEPVKIDTSGPREAKRGRPRIEDIPKTLKATEPWSRLGMSRRTWYRRLQERRATVKTAQRNDA